jgi:stage III sporulation protein AG
MTWLQSEKGLRLVVLLGVAGMGLILLSGLFGTEKTEESTEETQKEELDTVPSQTTEEYCASLEETLSEMLSQMEGVGTCQVMLTLSGSVETVYAKDMETDSGENKTKSSQTLVLVEEDGGESPLVEKVLSPEISGVLVLCQGASSSAVREKVTKATKAVLGVGYSRICVEELA